MGAKDRTQRGPEDFFAARRIELEARLDELRPALAEADRIRRLLRSMDALGAQYNAGTTQAETRGDGRKRFPDEARRLQALSLIGRRPEIRRTDIAASLGVQAARAGKIVNSLVRDGLVEDRGPGGLLLTEKGEMLSDGRDPGGPAVEINPEVRSP